MRISKFVTKSGYDPCTSALTSFFYAGDSPQKEQVDYDIYYENGDFIVCRHFVKPPSGVAEFGCIVVNAAGQGYIRDDSARELMTTLATKYPRRRASEKQHGWVWDKENICWITEPKLNEDGTPAEVAGPSEPNHAAAHAKQLAQAERDSRKFGNLPQKRNVLA